MGLDEGLPNFYIRQSKDVKHEGTIFLSESGADALPAYNIRHPDPASSQDAHNRYAAALYDAYNPEVLFAEVLLIPEWSLPTLSQDEIRRNGGITPPPQPVLPNKFIVQLYNPDMQITVIYHPSTWNSAQCWEFEIPVHTFRLPSVSALDKAQDDPGLSEATPKVEFRWKRDSKLTKDLMCSLNGRKNADKGRKHKEPDIPMAFFRNLKEVTLYEPNMHRIDMEDPKGFEIALLLSAVTIKDVYFRNIREAFNISESRSNSLSAPPPHPARSSAPVASPIPGPGYSHSNQPRPSLAVQTKPAQPPRPSPGARPPPTDPRTQWEIDAETARLKKQVEAEERVRKQNERQQEKLVRKMVEDEQKAARKRQDEIDKETERLRKAYEAEQKRLRYPPQQSSRPGGNSFLSPAGPYSGSSAYAASTSTFLAGDGGSQPQVKPKRSSFFGLRGGGEDTNRALLTKKSAIF